MFPVPGYSAACRNGYHAVLTLRQDSDRGMRKRDCRETASWELRTLDGAVF